jgi:hypothetical protein
LNAIEGGLSRLLDLLTARPNANELLKTLETDLLAKFKLSNAIIFTLDSHNISKEIYSNNLTLEEKNKEFILAGRNYNAELEESRKTSDTLKAELENKGMDLFRIQSELQSLTEKCKSESTKIYFKKSPLKHVGFSAKWILS